MKSKLENIHGVDYLSFQVEGLPHLTRLPVITKGSRDKNNAWTWNGNTSTPTLKPSIRTKYADNKGELTEIHYWLTDGVCNCLADCQDGNSGKSIPLKDI